MSSKVLESLNEARETEANLLAEAEMLEARLQEIQTQILLKRGAIQALESLIDTTGSLESSSGSGGISESQEGSGRSARSTKEEMRERRKVVAALLYEKGGATVSDLLRDVVDRLGKEIKPHHLRNVLKKFTSDFVKGEEHGVWLLSDEAKNRYSTIDFDDVDSESDSETS